ncbi:MAG: hypothetical protein RIB60_10140 [Phycisphaerales bacterium]
MKTTMKACLFGGAVFAAGIANAGDTYRIYGPSQAETSGYGIGDATTADLVGALENPYIFSHWASIFDASIIVTPWAYLDSNEQQFGDCLIFPWMWDGDLSATELANAQYHFLNGGDLIVLSDSNYTDDIGASLGIPTSGYAADFNINAVGFLANGPFGDPTGAVAGGSVGTLNLVDVAVTNGQVLATNNAGQVLAAFWDDNRYAPGAGRMIIVTDVNTIAGGFGAWDYNDLNNPNTRFALNLFAGMIGSDPCNDADLNADGVLNFDDIDLFVEEFLGGCGI